MDIIYFTDNIDGGAETQVYMRLQHMPNRSGHRVKMFYCNTAEEKIIQRLAERQIAVQQVDAPKSNDLSPGYIERLGQILLEEQPEVMVVFWHSILGLSAAMAARITPGVRVKLFLEIQGSVALSLYTPWQVLVLPLIDRVIPCSRLVAGAFREYFHLPGAQVVPVVNGAEPGPEPSPPDLENRDGPIVITMVGRFHPQKDYLTFLKAARLLHSQSPGKYLFYAIGSGSCRDGFIQTANQFGLREVVRFPGFVADVSGLLQQTHVFCLATHFEGMPVTILEAMKHGLPIVATAVDGIPEEVIPGHNGFLVSLGNPEELAAAIEKVIGEPEQYKTFSRNSYQLLQNQFDIRDIARFLEDLFTGDIPPLYPQDHIDKYTAAIRELVYHPRDFNNSLDITSYKGLNHAAQLLRTRAAMVSHTPGSGQTAEIENNYHRLFSIFQHPRFFPGSRLKGEAFCMLLEYALIHPGEPVRSRMRRELEAYYQGREKSFLEEMKSAAFGCSYTFYRIGSLFFKNRINGPAREIFQAILSRGVLPGPLIFGSYFYLGEISRSTGHNSRAIEYYKQCLQVEPGHQKARETLDQLEQ